MSSGDGAALRTPRSRHTHSLRPALVTLREVPRSSREFLGPRASLASSPPSLSSLPHPLLAPGGRYLPAQRITRVRTLRGCKGGAGGGGVAQDAAQDVGRQPPDGPAVRTLVRGQHDALAVSARVAALARALAGGVEQVVQRHREDCVHLLGGRQARQQRLTVRQVRHHRRHRDAAQGKDVGQRVQHARAQGRGRGAQLLVRLAQGRRHLVGVALL
mmetsp:Transcript_8887/g.36752  ORF Transcript_8887/g.36752 Transcript_8887/m.36752 type:complete len:216 (+) Transcript_8887:172-819(+)